MEKDMHSSRVPIHSRCRPRYNGEFLAKPMKSALVPSLLFFLSCSLSFGDEQVRRVQEELRKRNLYFADIDGKKSKEMTVAIRRYQERKGFAPTGELDAETLRSLDLAPPEPVGEALPDVPVLKSDMAREMAESDRKLLEAIESSKPPPPVGEAPPPPAKPPAGEVPPAPINPAPAELPPTPVKPTRVEPSDGKTSRLPRPRPPREDTAAAPLVQRAESFVRAYLDVCETSELDAEMAFYGDRVNYFDHGVVGRDFIARDVNRYYRRWPQRDYELLDFELGKATENEVEVKFRIAFKVKSPEHSAAGRTVNLFKIRQAGDDLRFVSLKEQRIRP